MLDEAKSSRLKLRMIAYALFSGERRSVTPPAAMEYLLYIINDPLSSNKSVSKLIEKALEAHRKDLRPTSVVGQSPLIATEPVKEKGICFETPDLVSLSHGGGLFFLLDYLKGDSDGYTAVGEYEGKGLFVFTKENSNPDSFYASRNELFFDIPTQIVMKVPGNIIGITNIQKKGSLEKRM